MRLERLPKLRPTGRTGPILPGFDIHIGRLEIRRLELAPAVTGKAAGRRGCRAAPTSAPAGRWSSSTARCEGGDRLLVKLDAEPDRDRFDIDVRATRAGRRPAAGLVRVEAAAASW